jgi:tRNA threonylcarbamoyladenosine biosynthesis protein TsaB
VNYLFVDSTYDLSLGLLDSQLNWLSFERFEGKKASVVIQSKTFELLQKYKIKSTHLAGVFVISGPGFYTGLRLSQGLTDVFNFFSVKSYSFYSYEIPMWCGFTQGSWFTKAYRGEYFLYKWKENQTEKKLLSIEDLIRLDQNESFFIHSDLSLDKFSEPHLINPISTNDLLLKYPSRIFQMAIANKSREIFYFRAPEDELNVNP